MPTAVRGREMWSKPKRVAHQLYWRGVTLRIEHTHDWQIEGNSRLRVMVVAPVDGVTPLTITGPKYIDIDTEKLIEKGGAVAYVTAILETEALRPWWKRFDAKRRQLALDI